jgi:hypothetical protein
VLKAMLIGAASAGVLVASYAVVVPDKVEPPPVAPAVVAHAESTSSSSPSARLDKGAGPSKPGAADEPAEPSEPSRAPSTSDRSQAEARGDRAPSRRPSDAEVEADPYAAPPSPSTPPAAEAASPGAAPITPAERASRMREESGLLSEARDALRRGDSATALRKLEEARTRFAGGMLGQEREALTIEALYRGGQREAASARAAAFLRAYPLSPHATRVQTFTR